MIDDAGRASLMERDEPAESISRGVELARFDQPANFDGERRIHRQVRDDAELAMGRGHRSARSLGIGLNGGSQINTHMALRWPKTCIYSVLQVRPIVDLCRFGRVRSPAHHNLLFLHPLGARL